MRDPTPSVLSRINFCTLGYKERSRITSFGVKHYKPALVVGVLDEGYDLGAVGTVGNGRHSRGSRVACQDLDPEEFLTNHVCRRKDGRGICRSNKVGIRGGATDI